MKRIRVDRWTYSLQPPRNPRLHVPGQRRLFLQHHPPAWSVGEDRRQTATQHEWQRQRRHASTRRKASSAAAVAQAPQDEALPPFMPHRHILGSEQDDTLAPIPLNAPSHRFAMKSAKLAALHARLSLPSTLPLQTLARCLIDPSVDPRPGYNNAPFAILGQELLGQYTAEWLLCRYPRLPMPIVFAAQYAYNGAATLAAMRAEWGVEVVAAPGQEVDAGLLQLKRVLPGNAVLESGNRRAKDMPQARRLGSGRRNEQFSYRRGMSSRIVYDDEFGDVHSGLPPADARPYPGAAISSPNAQGSARQAPLSGQPPPQPRTPADTDPTTVEAASASFVRALAGALYLHAGSPAVKGFHRAHFLSRHLALHTLFHFNHPTRDLSALCKREGLEPPVARVISETGRHSRTPVYVVGVFSGDDKLGEAAGASLNEGRVRAAAAALQSWYLYSPVEGEVALPSDVESGGEEAKKKWKPQMVDMGEIVT